jgi:hypothetical protein
MESEWQEAHLYRWEECAQFDAQYSDGKIFSSCSDESASYELHNGKVCLPGPYPFFVDASNVYCNSRFDSKIIRFYNVL